MTLQQKLLTKKSKKGFTLVELVVVIAILAVLAAIAIPSVIGIINSASQSQIQTDAASIDSAVKDYHAGIIGGSINKTNAGKSTQTDLPAANAGNGERSKVANGTNTNVEQACKWYGIYDRLSASIDNKDFAMSNGSVVAGKDGNGVQLYADSAVIAKTTSAKAIMDSAAAAAKK